MSRVIELPLSGADDQTLEIDLAVLSEDPTELCEILDNESAIPTYWITIAVEYVKQNYFDQAVDILERGLQSPAVVASRSERMPFYSLLASIHLRRARESVAASREKHMVTAVQSLNEAQRIDPSAPINMINRAIWASLKDVTQSATVAKAFEDTLHTDPANLYAMFGRARLAYQKRNYRGALTTYQQIMAHRPDLLTPDPRIGIGLCFWQLKMKDDARLAWDRALELNAECVAAHGLLGQWYFDAAAAALNDRQVKYNYGLALKYANSAYKLSGQRDALSGIVLASYLFAKGDLDKSLAVSQRALGNTDMALTQNDAHFWIGRVHHQRNELDKATAAYQKARSVKEDAVLPLVALGQLQILQEDIVGAKLTFERIVEANSRCIEALVVLGTIYAQEAVAKGYKADRTIEFAKARKYIESALSYIEKSDTRVVDDSEMLLTQARILEVDNLSASLESLQKAADLMRDLGIQPSPQLYNNIGVLSQRKQLMNEARIMYDQAARSLTPEFEYLSPAISFNIARLEQDAGNIDLSKGKLQELLDSHPDYVDAALRLCYLDFESGDLSKANKSLKQLMASDSKNLEVRAFCTWFLGKTRKSSSLKNLNEDPEYRHLLQTLRHFDRHDTYSLTAFGNHHLRQAREIRPTGNHEKEKQRRAYERGVEWFDKCLSIDPKNAFAAQGIAIALAENRLFSKAVIVFNKVRETVKDVSIMYNLGHCLADLRQYARSIECYEAVIDQYRRTRDVSTWLCLGRVWFLRGKEEKNADFLRKSTEVTKRVSHPRKFICLY